jgi:hypothetical protein
VANTLSLFLLNVWLNLYDCSQKQCAKYGSPTVPNIGKVLAVPWRRSSGRRQTVRTIHKIELDWAPELRYASFQGMVITMLYEQRVRLCAQIKRTINLGARLQRIISSLMDVLAVRANWPQAFYCPSPIPVSRHISEGQYGHSAVQKAGSSRQ